MKKLLLAILIVAAMSGCSSEPTKPAASQPTQPKAPELITGSSAFFKCYIAARGWAQDAQPFRIESVASKTGDGKAGEWRAGFASVALHSTRSFTWSNGEISHSTDDTYSPTNSSTQVFNVQFLKADTDKAFAVAQQHGGDKVLAKSPDTPILYVLDWNHQTNQLLWHVIYGTDRETAPLRVAVNAATGDFSKVEK
ncbi:MAG: membrane lipoprotein lipid attachment site-containing protein [Terriglobales bacterium]